MRADCLQVLESASVVPEQGQAIMRVIAIENAKATGTLAVELRGEMAVLAAKLRAEISKSELQNELNALKRHMYAALFVQAAVFLSFFCLLALQLR